MTSVTDSTSKSPTSSFRSWPSRPGGYLAGGAALCAVAALALSVVLNLVFEALGHVPRLLIVWVFTVSGVSALVLSLRCLAKGERSFVVWAALIVGISATSLMIAELTILE